MTAKQIQTYEYCKKYLAKLEGHVANLPFKSQEFGCGSTSPIIEHSLEKIHKEMYEAVFHAIWSAQQEVDKIIADL